MQYLGGKYRIAKQVANVLKQYLGNHETYLEPFCGALNVTVQMADCGLPIIAADANQYLITMWQAVFNGWQPPENLSEQEYKEIKDNKDIANPMTAFAGFGCSFAGQWFDCFSKCKRERNYAKEAKNSILRKYQKLKDSDIKFESISYEELGQVNEQI